MKQANKNLPRSSADCKAAIVAGIALAHFLALCCVSTTSTCRTTIICLWENCW